MVELVHDTNYSLSMPVLTGVSVFCLVKRDSMLFTNLFGGSNGNEGLGLLSLSFDWQYIGSTPLWLPLQTLANNLIGWALCIIVFMGVYYGNVWNAKKFPFLSQLLFTEASNGTHYEQFNQSAILNSKMEVDHSLIEGQGLPYFASTFAAYILSTNLAITATFTHMFLWNFDDIKSAWSFASVANLKHAVNPKAWNWRFWNKKATWGGDDDDEMDPHYRLMLAYQDAPNWWYGMVLILSILVGLIMLYLTQSTLPWWGFLIACALSSICILFFGAQTAITGFAFNVQPVIQMLGGYLHPGKPGS
jgi:hypothetical protein